MVAISRPIELCDNEQSERRIFGRIPHRFHADAVRLDHSIVARRRPRVGLEVRDVSLNGLSAISDQPVLRGEHVSVSFPSDSHLPGWSAFGRVVRCEPSAMGYRMAVEFDPLPAA